MEPYCIPLPLLLPGGGGGSHWLMSYGDAQRFKGAFSLLGAYWYINGWTQCAQFAKLGVFRKIKPEDTQYVPNWVFFCGNSVMGHKITLLRYRDGQNSEVYFEPPAPYNFFKNPSPPPDYVAVT